MTSLVRLMQGAEKSAAWHHAPGGRWRQATPPAIGEVGLDLVLPHTVHCWRFMQREQQAGVANLVPLIASGVVDPSITGVYTRAQAPEAHRLLEGRLSQGKLALVHPN